MSQHDIKSAERPAPDTTLIAIADYAKNYKVESSQAYETARYCLMDTLACGFQALKYPACTKLLGPVVPGATMSGGARVPGTSFELDPVQAAFNIGAMIRWLDFNDTWLAAEWGQVFFKDGSATPRIQVDYPIGHRKRREEGMPVLVKKFESSVNAHFEPRQAARVNALFADAKVDDMPVDEFVNTMVVR